MPYLVDELVTSVRRRGSLPSYDEGSAAAILAVLNDEQSLYLAALLEGAAENYRTAVATVPVVAGQLTYALPRRAVAAGIKQIQTVDSSGRAWGTYELRPEDWPAGGTVWTSPSNRFYLYGNNIGFYGSARPGSLSVAYPLRMSQLVLSTDTVNCLSITSLNAATGVMVLSNAYTNASGLCDVVRATPHFDILGLDVAFTGSGTATLTFTAGLPAGVVVGDYVCQPGYSPVCQAPLELHQVLAQRAAAAILTQKGDQRAGMAVEQLKAMAKDAMALLQPRPGRARSIINYSSPGFRGWRL